jgi:hypothetical protein
VLQLLPPLILIPNAVLIVDDEIEQRQDYAIIELFNPQYDPEANTLRYDITAENVTTTTSINLPREFGQSTLVIDDDGDDERSITALEVQVYLFCLLFF